MAEGPAPSPPPADSPEGRRLALICNVWGHASTFFSWTWMKQYLLRRAPDGHLDPTERLYIVKAGKEDAKDEKWKVGGPLIPDLDTALRSYPHTVVQLDGGLKGSVPAFLQQHGIDIMIVPDHWPQSALHLTSVSDWVKQNLNCPFIIIRRNAVVNARMKIGSQSSSSAAGSPDGASSPGLGRISPAPAAVKGRRIAIAYNSFTVGRGLMQFAKDKVLTQADTIYICHSFSNQNPVMKETMKMMRVLTLQRAESETDVTRDNSIEFGAAELAGYNVMLNVVLQGDAKQALSSFCEREDIDLLVVGTRSAGKLRKKLGGGGVSSHLIDNAPCPCLVVPYQCMGIEVSRDTADEEVASPTGVAAVRGGSPPPGLPREAAAQAEGGAAPAQAATVAEALAAGGGVGGRGGEAHSTPSDLLAQLQRQLEEKDRVIAELRQEVQALRLAAAQRDSAAMQDASGGSGLTL